MSAIFSKAVPYAGDILNLPVGNVDDALAFYETVMGFKTLSRSEAPHKSAILTRDQIRIGLAENGGDPNQNGCFFEVDNVEDAFAELKSRGLKKDDPGFRVDRHNGISWRVFFVVAPDGLCFCLGQRHNAP